MRIAVVLAGAVMAVVSNRFVRCQLLEPVFVILMQAGFIVIDEYAAGNVHRIHEYKALLDLAFP